MQIDSVSGLDAGPMGNKMRFVNHSCEPNCEFNVSLFIRNYE